MVVPDVHVGVKLHPVLDVDAEFVHHVDHNLASV